MKVRIKRKGNKIWIRSSICIVLGIGVIGGVCYKRVRQKSADEMKEIATTLFNEHINEMMNQMKKDQVKWRIEINQLQIISGNLEEFIVKINYDIDLMTEIACEYRTEQWMMRIKRRLDESYEVIEAGEEL